MNLYDFLDVDFTMLPLDGSFTSLTLSDGWVDLLPERVSGGIEIEALPNRELLEWLHTSEITFLLDYVGFSFCTIIIKTADLLATQLKLGLADYEIIPYQVKIVSETHYELGIRRLPREAIL